MNATIPLSMPAALRQQIRRLAKRLRRTQSDVLRECVQVGLSQFSRRLQNGDDYLHPPVMTPGEARRLFRPQTEWDVVEAAAVRHSLKALKPDAE